MSKQEKFSKFNVGLGDALDKIPLTPPGPPKTSPGKLMAFTLEKAAYEEKIKKLQMEAENHTSIEIEIKKIEPNPWQPRTYFDPKAIENLADSIKETGLIQPIIIRSVPNRNTEEINQNVPTRNTLYQIITGERRFRAHQLLGLERIKAVVLEVSDEEMSVMALAENISRTDLSDYEISKAIVNAENQFPNRKEMAIAIGMGRTSFYRYLTFKTLPDVIIKDLELAPYLLGASCSEDISNYIKNGGDRAREAIIEVWGRVVAGQLKQNDIIPAAESHLKGTIQRTDRDIRKLFIDKIQAGSITRDANNLTVKIKSGHISEEKENILRDFVQKLLVE